MEAVAKLRNVPTSPRKMRLVANLVRGKRVTQALGLLRFEANSGAEKVEKLLLSALANWQQHNPNERIEEAEPLRNAKLWLPLSELPELASDQFYFHEVIGFQVIDANMGPLGTVENFYELPQQNVLAMRYQGQEVLIPVVDELVSHADTEARQLFVSLPEGLLDIYLNPSAHKNPNAD